MRLPLLLREGDSGALLSLVRGGVMQIIGIGDRPSDLEAYARSGLRVILVSHSTGAQPSAVREALSRANERKLRLEKEGKLPPTATFAYFSDCAAIHSDAAFVKSLGVLMTLSTTSTGNEDVVWKLAFNYIKAL